MQFPPQEIPYGIDSGVDIRLYVPVKSTGANFTNFEQNSLYGDLDLDLISISCLYDHISHL